MSLLNELKDAEKYLSYASAAGDYSQAFTAAYYVLGKINPQTYLTPQERQIAISLAYKVGDYNLATMLHQQENE